MLVALNATKYVVMTVVTAILIYKSHHAVVVTEAFLQVTQFRSSKIQLHQPTTSPDTMDLVCHGPSTVNPDAINPLITVYVLYTLCVF